MRVCQFCGCTTNAAVRACCQWGRNQDSGLPITRRTYHIKRVRSIYGFWLWGVFVGQAKKPMMMSKNLPSICRRIQSADMNVGTHLHIWGMMK